jgi:hypothetical protein
MCVLVFGPSGSLSRLKGSPPAGHQHPFWTAAGVLGRQWQCQVRKQNSEFTTSIYWWEEVAAKILKALLMFTATKVVVGDLINQVCCN